MGLGEWQYVRLALTGRKKELGLHQENSTDRIGRLNLATRGYNNIPPSLCRPLHAFKVRNFFALVNDIVIFAVITISSKSLDYGLRWLRLCNWGLLHRRWIGRGGNSDVHEACPPTSRH